MRSSPMIPRDAHRARRFAWIRIACLSACLVILGRSAAGAQVTLLSNSLDEHVARSGEQYDGTLVVRNDSPLAQAVRVYLTDYHFSAAGATRFDAPGSTPRSNAGWISLETMQAPLAGGETRRIGYRVRVPGDTSDQFVGSYWSMVMVEGSAPAAAPAPQPGQQARTSLAVVVRYGVLIVTHIGDTGAPEIEFLSPTVTGTPGTDRELVVDIRNRGTRADRVVVSVDVYGENGERVAHLSAKRGLVPPGSSIRQHFALGRLAPGRYTALVLSETGLASMFGAEYTFQF